MRRRIRLSEGQLRRVVKESVYRIITEMEDDETPHDYYEDGIYNHEQRKKECPLDWDILTDEDGEKIYRDPDGIEYWKDVYGRFHQMPTEGDLDYDEDEDEDEGEDDLRDLLRGMTSPGHRTW